MKLEQKLDREKLEAEQSDWNMPSDAMSADAQTSSIMTRIGDDGLLV